MASSHRWVVCRISFPVCLLKRHFWLPDETVVNFTLSEPWASRRREALCASACPSPFLLFRLFSLTCALATFSFTQTQVSKTSHRGHWTILCFVPPVYITPPPLSARIRTRRSGRRPRRVRRWGDDSVCGGHGTLVQSACRRLFCLEQKTASPCMTHRWHSR